MTALKSVKSSWQQRTVNFIGGLGYFISVLEWLFAVVLFVPAIQSACQQLMPTGPASVTPPIQAAPSPGLLILGIIITVVILGLTLYILFRIPYSIAKTSKNTTHHLAASLAPAIIKHQHVKDTARRRLIITEQLIVIFKLAIVVLPMAFVALAHFMTAPFDVLLITFVCSTLGATALALFLAQFGLAHLLKVPRRDIW